MLKFGVFLPFICFLPKIDENREKRCTFVPDNNDCLQLTVYGLQLKTL